jgi:transcriptional regulator
MKETDSHEYGFKVKINKIVGKAKLSQNHPLYRQKLIVDQLKRFSNTNEQKISLLMKSNLKNNRMLLH